MRYQIIATNDGRKWDPVDMAESWEKAWEKYNALRAANPNKSYHIIPV